MVRDPVTHYFWGILNHGSTTKLRETIHVLKSVMTVEGEKTHDLFIVLGRHQWKELSFCKALLCLCFGASVSHLWHRPLLQCRRWWGVIVTWCSLLHHKCIKCGILCFHSHRKWSLWIICSLFSGVHDLKYHHVISFLKGTNKICLWNE